MLDAIKQKILVFLLFAISISLHECAHAYTAYRLGDSTAKDKGRITLNPLRHLDPLGTLMIVLVGFGWAKPTPVDARYFKDRKRGMMYTSLAGPVSNLLLAIVFAIPVACFNLYYTGHEISDVVYTVYVILYTGFSLNVMLAIFNLLPVSPLDGSKILGGILPSNYYFKMLEYERYITIAFFLLMVSGFLDKIISPIISFVQNGILFVFLQAFKFIL